jgi:hypothetical protein
MQWFTNKTFSKKKEAGYIYPASKLFEKGELKPK